MKVSIEYENKVYILEYSRKTASELSNALAKSNNEPDIFLQGELMIKYAMKKKHKAYRHITAENISISILQNHTIPKHSFVDHPLQSISKQCLGTGNIPVNKSESVDFYWE